MNPSNFSPTKLPVDPWNRTHYVPAQKPSAAADKLAKYRHDEDDGQAKDGAAACPGEERHAAETAKVLDAIATLQGTLTAKVDEVKIDISLLRQDLSKLKDRVTETETRISTAEDILHPLQLTTEDMQRQIQQLHSPLDDMENRIHRYNLRFIGLLERAEGKDPSEYLENLLITAYGREAFSVMIAVERVHHIPEKPPPAGAPPKLLLPNL